MTETLGRYRLSARLAVGGMAELFVGQLVGASGFEKLVAIKRMLPHLSADPEFVAMFVNEGRIAATLGHPNLCQVYELGEANGQLFLAMELVRGLAWSEIVPAIPDRPAATMVRFVVGVLVQACEGLYHAHTATDVSGRPRPIVHRDVSPTNLMITNEGVVKLLDFGVSKLLAEGDATRSGMIKGKLPYMSPEQIRHQTLDARSDIFSLGVVAWEAIAGRALFDRGSDFEIFQAILEDELPALPGRAPAAEALEDVIRRALSRDREQRHATARAFADELRAASATFGAPMVASELQQHVELWLGPSLKRRSRDLADLVGQLRGEPRPPPSADATSVHVPSPEPGVRLRDQSLVVGDAADEVPTVDRHAATTVEAPTPPTAPTLPEQPGISPSGELTLPHDVIVVPVPASRVEVSIPRAREEPPAPSWWLPVIIVALLAIATALVIGLRA